MEASILANPKIISVGASDGNLGRSTYQTSIQVDTSEYNTQVLAVGKNFFGTVGLRFLEGRPLNVELASDLTEAAVVNRAFVEKTQIKDPIGKIITIHGGKRAIVGVVENHIDNLYRTADPEPFAFYVAPKDKYISLLVRTDPSDLREIEQYLEKTWKELFPGRPFESDTQDDLLLADVRRANVNLEQIFFFITLLGGLLSVAGIFALTSLNVAKRTKEIGIRKALGATIPSIVSLLNREFALVLAIAAVLGATGGYYGTSLLMSNLFAYHIPVSLTPVVACGVAVIAMGLVTTSATILRAAKANPVDALRSE